MVRKQSPSNMHLHGHLNECILDVGPLYSSWWFSFECYNGILEKMKRSWHAPEQQLIHPQIFKPPNTCCHCSSTRPFISGLVVLKYKHNLMCLPQEMCVIKQSFQYLVPPGREKYMLDNQRHDITNVRGREPGGAGGA